MELAFTASSHVGSVGIADGGSRVTITPKDPRQLDAIFTVISNFFLLSRDAVAAQPEHITLTLHGDHVRPHDVLDVLAQAGLADPIDVLIAKSNLDAVFAGGVTTGQYGNARRAS